MVASHPNATGSPAAPRRDELPVAHVGVGAGPVDVREEAAGAAAEQPGRRTTGVGRCRGRSSGG